MCLSVCLSANFKILPQCWIFLPVKHACMQPVKHACMQPIKHPCMQPIKHACMHGISGLWAVRKLNSDIEQVYVYVWMYMCMYLSTRTTYDIILTLYNFIKFLCSTHIECEYIILIQAVKVIHISSMYKHTWISCTHALISCVRPASVKISPTWSVVSGGHEVTLLYLINYPWPWPGVTWSSSDTTLQCGFMLEIELQSLRMQNNPVHHADDISPTWSVVVRLTPGLHRTPRFMLEIELQPSRSRSRTLRMQNNPGHHADDLSPTWSVVSNETSERTSVLTHAK
jgi:hypothetical protein